jgi:hypothetical protein
MTDPNTTPPETPSAKEAVAVSPTGEPLIPPSLVRWLLPIYLVLATSGFGLLEALDVGGKGVAIYAFVVSTLGVLLGVASPGIRKAGTVAALLLALSLTGCAATKRVARSTLDCAAPAMVAQAKAVAPVVLDALLKPSTDWSAELDHLVLAAGAAGICAVRAVVAEIQAKPQPTTAWTGVRLEGASSNDELQLARASRWLKANGLD